MLIQTKEREREREREREIGKRGESLLLKISIFNMICIKKNRT